MKTLRKKLHSQSGASILLALLFFLVSMLVAASVLVAAVSNAGKLRSNYDEQQKYMALSSALRLVCGELEKAQYTGKYEVCRWTVPAVVDEDGNIITPAINYYHVRQTEGEFVCGKLENSLDFTQALDGLFAEEFAGRAGYSPLSGVTAPPSTKTLTVIVDGDPAVKEKFPSVEVTVKLRKDLRIQMTAVLDPKYDEAGNLISPYQMQAELEASGLPTLNFTPGPDEFAGGSPGAGSTSEVKSTDPIITWKLDWVSKGVAGG